MEGTDMERGAIKFSLILATVGRVEELSRFLECLTRQTYRCFELILVDQNPGGLIDPLVNQYKDKFPLLHLRSGRGLARARNMGLKHFSGQVAAFPDDDCWYAPDTLEKVARAFHENPKSDGICGRGVDESRPDDFIFFSRRNGWVSKKNVWQRSTSISIFLRSQVIRSIGSFDPSLGIGSQDGRNAGEEGDYLIRAIESGFRIYYLSEVCIFHPYPLCKYDSEFIKKCYGYSVGFGYVLRKHNYPISFVVHSWLRALGGAVVSALTLNLPKSRYHFAVLKGRVLGWLG
jgi:glycosyltransferase involved in cell wall biosynthesis